MGASPCVWIAVRLYLGSDDPSVLEDIIQLACSDVILYEGMHKSLRRVNRVSQANKI